MDKKGSVIVSVGPTRKPHCWEENRTSVNPGGGYNSYYQGWLYERLYDMSGLFDGRLCGFHSSLDSGLCDVHSRLDSWLSVAACGLHCWMNGIMHIFLCRL
ncbi:unnamed protein product [Callosobruchus maculatus]|uniref:Uncharacterized protein n=1 Tax=Callosobruchus maculatus TaxID=64391 RepID=A0A653D227_CALMS|nr:unnamed protein product [Callosobruchus maculatus]